MDRLNNLVVPTLSGNRLLLLGPDHVVVYDSQNMSLVGRYVPVGAGAPTRTPLEGSPYLTATQQIPPARDPLHAMYVVLAQPESSVASAAAGELASRLLEAGGAALVVALLLSLLISRSVTGPLTQLAAAAEDIAAGNYSRRVNITGPDEIGMLGSAFNLSLIHI